MPLGYLRARAGVAEFVPLNGPEEEKVFFDLQRREPQQLSGIMWVYKDNIIRHDGGVGDMEETILEIKHHILRQERDYQKMKREVQAFENMEKMD